MSMHLALLCFSYPISHILWGVLTWLYFFWVRIPFVVLCYVIVNLSNIFNSNISLMRQSILALLIRKDLCDIFQQPMFLWPAPTYKDSFSSLQWYLWHQILLILYLGFWDKSYFWIVSGPFLLLLFEVNLRWLLSYWSIETSHII